VFTGEDIPQKLTEIAQHLIGGIGVAFLHQNGDRIERVKQEMRLQLTLEGNQASRG